MTVEWRRTEPRIGVRTGSIRIACKGKIHYSTRVERRKRVANLHYFVEALSCLGALFLLDELDAAENNGFTMGLQ
jgi:hypothetical protein